MMGLCRPYGSDTTNGDKQFRYRCAIAGAPVTHWDGYDSHYTGTVLSRYYKAAIGHCWFSLLLNPAGACMCVERYMGRPQENTSGYGSSAVMTHVNHLQGQYVY